MSSGSCPRSFHGNTHGRGCSHSGLGTFGRLFELSPFFVSDQTLKALGQKNGLMHEQDRRGNSNIPAAYTFFAQFIDHDLTLDVTSQLNSTRVQPPESIPNMRSMTLDLDCVYGFGPEASPHLYRDEKLAVGNPINPRDLARVITTNSAGDVDDVDDVGRALIGDPRNDENLFVSQLQFAFHLFHNRLIDEQACGDFETAQRLARFHYQYIVLHDFLARICDPDVYRFALERIYQGEFPLFFGQGSREIVMPVEFSVAAYRFGHSMVRDVYQPNAKVKRVELFSDESNGFEAVKKKLTVQWRFLFESGNLCKGRKIDERLAGELVELPEPVVDDANPLNRSLPFRNLVRGRSLGLPSGQDVASTLADAGYPIDPDLDLKLTKVAGWSSLDAAVQRELQNGLPLFFYLLRESSVTTKGQHLGPTGSAILMEVFGGILMHCQNSFVNESWSPADSIVGSDHELKLDDILRYVDVYDPR